MSKHPPKSPYHLQTEPGSGGMMAPCIGSVQSFEDYRHAMLDRFRRDPEARQCMLIAARRFDPCPDLSPVTFYGSYADWAKEIIARLNRQLTEQPQETRH